MMGLFHFSYYSQVHSRDSTRQGRQKPAPWAASPEGKITDPTLQPFPPQAEAGSCRFSPTGSWPRGRRGSVTSECVLVQTFAFVPCSQTSAFLVNAWFGQDRNQILRKPPCEVRSWTYNPVSLSPQGETKSWVFPPSCSALLGVGSGSGWGRNCGDCLRWISWVNFLPGLTWLVLHWLGL